MRSLVGKTYLQMTMLRPGSSYSAANHMEGTHTGDSQGSFKISVIQNERQGCKAFEQHCKGSSLQSELQGAMGSLKCHHRKGSVFDSFINDSTEDALWAENLAGQD